MNAFDDRERIHELNQRETRAKTVNRKKLDFYVVPETELRHRP